MLLQVFCILRGIEIKFVCSLTLFFVTNTGKCRFGKVMVFVHFVNCMLSFNLLVLK